MPELDAKFAPRASLLQFEEMFRIASLLVDRCGIRDIRLTGGEPLVRRELYRLVEMLAGIPGLEDLAMTTNGMLLAEQAEQLRNAGLKRLNVSLDTLSEATFQKISRREGLDRVIAGIDAAIAVEFESIKLNSLAIRGMTEPEIVRLVEFSIQRGVELRFIEFMPLDADKNWTEGAVLSGGELKQILEAEFGKLVEIPRADPAQPAESFEIPGGHRVGIIRSVTAPFCGSCNRLRLTADGSIRNCLFATEETPLRDAMRGGASDEELLELVRRSVQNKRATHGIDHDGFSPPERPMYSIGG